MTVQVFDLLPRAAALIEGTLDFGYKLETTLADIVDIVITARQTK